jgi:Iodothyronine deiodinase
LYRRYKGRADFVAVYVREAHPADGWILPGNEKIGISVTQHKDFGERCDVANECCSALKMTIPMVVDEIDDRVGIAYSGMPDRLYVVDSQGRVAYKGGRGPFGFKPSELEQALVLLLTDELRVERPASPPRPAVKGR